MEWSLYIFSLWYHIRSSYGLEIYIYKPSNLWKCISMVNEVKYKFGPICNDNYYAATAADISTANLNVGSGDHAQRAHPHCKFYYK